MLYLVSRLQTTVSFDKFLDTELWKSLVPEVTQINDFVWKFWLISEVNYNNFQTSTYFLRDGEWRRTELITQTSACYLSAEQYNGRTTFTIISASQMAFLKLVALIENLYEPVTPISLNTFLGEYQTLPVRSINLFQQKTNEEVRFDFARPINLTILQSIFLSLGWEFLSISVIPRFPKPLNITELYLNMQGDQVSFSLPPEEQLLPGNELIQLNKILRFANIVFKVNFQTERRLAY